MELRYGTNPHQTPASVSPLDPDRAPFKVVNGGASFINMLDAVSAWQLVTEASASLDGRPVATTFKHVSPAGAATDGPLDKAMAELYRLDKPGPLAGAYVRARDADPKSSYGDFIAVSHPVDAELAELLARLVSDGIVAPGFEEGVVGTLSQKKKGAFLVLEGDAAFEPPVEETREVFGLRFSQPRDDAPLGRELFSSPLTGTLTDQAIVDMLLGQFVGRYTQSNSVCYVKDGMTLGIGAGQQSRIDCTKLAGSKVDTWWLRRHPKVRSLPSSPDAKVQERVNDQILYLEGELATGHPPLTAAERELWLRGLDGVSLVSDGFLPFRDNVDHARRHGVRYIAEPGGSVRSDDVKAACEEHGIALVHTGVRLFHH